MALIWAANYATLADSYGVGFTNVQYQQDGGAVVNNAAGIPGQNHPLLGNSLYCTLAPNEIRREATPPNGINDFGEGADRYFRFDFVLDSNFEINTQTRHHILSQIHSASPTASPPLEFDVVDGGLYTRGASDAGVFNLLFRRLVDLTAGVKYSVIFRVKFSATAANCLVEVWVNGTLVLSEVPTHAMINGGGNSYWKGAGLYRASSFDSTEGCWQSAHGIGTTYADVAALASVNPSVSTLASDFTTLPTFFTDNWGGAAIVAGQASVPTVSGYAGFGTGFVYSLTGSSVYVQVVTASGTSGSRQNSLKVSVDLNNNIELMLDGGVFKGRVTRNSLSTDVLLSGGVYAPATHVYWRIREAGGTVFFDTSTNAATWTNRGSLVHNLTGLGAVQLTLQAGHWAAETGTVNAVYDNLNLSPTSSTAHARTATDALGVADSSTRTVGATAAAATDVALVTDTVARTAGYQRATTDAAGVGDSSSYVRGLAAAFVEPVGLSDSASEVGFGTGPFGQLPFGSGTAGVSVEASTDYQRWQVDTAGVADTRSAASVAERGATDAAAVADSVSTGTANGVEIVDAIDVVDELDNIAGVDVEVTDAAGVADAISTEAEYAPALSDALAVVDTAERSVEYSIEYSPATTDILGATDTVTAEVGKFGEVTDAIGVADTATGVVSLTATIVDALDAADTVTRIAPATRGILDPAATADSRDIVGVGRVTAPAEATNETDTAVELTPAVSMAVPVAIETDTATAPTRVAQTNVPLATEADTATAPRPTGSYPTEQAGEWDITFPPIVLVDDGEFGTAIEDVDRTPVYVLKADWNRNGLYDHPLSDLTSLVTDVSVSKALSGTLPSEVGIVEGYSSAELSVTLEGEIPTAFTQLDERRNLVINPSFESNTIGWTSNGEHAATTMPREQIVVLPDLTIIPRSGGWHAYTRRTTAGNLLVYPSSTSAVVAGAAYTGSVYVNIGGVNAPRLDIDWHDAAGTFIATTTGVTASAPPVDTWIQLITTGQAPGSATRGRIVIRFNGISANTYVRVDAALFEQKTGVMAGTYFDGNSGGASWVGTVNNSVSVRGGVIGAPRDGREFDVVDAFAPYRPDAPLYGYPVLQTPIYLETGFLADDGPRLARRFTGTVAQIHPSSLARTVELRGLDPVARLRATLTLSGVAMYESILARYGPEQYRGRMNSQWLIDFALRRNGIYTSPPCRDNAILSVTGHGSMIPEIGWGGAPQEYYTTYRGEVWQAGRFGGALCTRGGNIGRWWLTEQVTAASGDGFGFSQWMGLYPTGQGADGQYLSMDLTTNASWFINFGIGTDGRPYLGSQQTGQAESRATPTGYAPPAAPRWAFVGVHVSFAATQMTVRFRIDQTTYTSTVTIGSRPGNWKPGIHISYHWQVPFQNFQLWRSASVPGTPWQGEDGNWVPQADLDPGVNELTGVPELLGVDSWELIKTITEAEGSTFQFDEFGRPQFRTSRGDLWYKRTKKVKETISADRNLADLVSTTDESTIRNVINIKTKAQLIGDWEDYYVAPAILVIPPGTSYFEVELPSTAYEIPPTLSAQGSFNKPGDYRYAGGDGFLFYETNELWEQRAKQLDSHRPFIRTMFARADNPTIWHGPNMPIRVTRLSPWRMQIVIGNFNAFSVQLSTTEERDANGFITKDAEPALIIPARLVRPGIEQIETYTDNASMNIYGASSFDVGGSEEKWRQAPQGFRNIATEVLSTTAHPVPVLESTDTPHDPRRKLGDQVVLRDPDGLGEVAGGIVALTQTFTNGPATDQVVVRPNGPPV